MWIYNLVQAPANAQIVWIRINWLAPPVLATYAAAAATFTLGDARVMPFWVVWKWKAS